MKKYFLLIASLSFMTYWMFGNQLTLDFKLPFQSSKISAIELPILRTLVWSGYIRKSVDCQLEDLLNIKIEKTIFNSNEEFIEILSDTSQSFDVIMPTDFMVSQLVREGLIEKIPYQQIPNYENIFLTVRRQKDLQNLFPYAVPFIFGTLSIGYNYWEIGDIPLHWKDLFEPKGNERLRGHIAIADDPRSSLGIALMVLDQSPNSTDVVMVKKAGEYIKKMMSQYLIRLQNNNMSDSLMNQDLLLTMAWSGETAKIMYHSEYNNQAMVVADCKDLKKKQLENQPKTMPYRSNVANFIRYSVPSQGPLLFFESFAILKSSTQKELAAKYINLMFEPDISAQITNTSYYATTNAQATPLVRRELLNGAPYFLPLNSENVYIRKHFTKAESAIYDEVWDEVRQHYEANIKPQLDNDVVFK